MTKEQTIKHLKLMQSDARNAIRFTKNDKEISEEERKEDIEIYQDQLEALDLAIKALEQQTNDCKIFGTKENCFGGATENECEHCDYKIQKLEQHSDDCVSRTQAIEWIENLRQMDKCFGNYEDDYFPLSEVIDRLKNVPPVTPTHGTCKDCTNYVVGALDEEICIRGHELIHKDFYCADFEKRGNENGSN